MTFIKQIFGTLNPDYLIRAYLIGIGFFGFIFVMVYNSASPVGVVTWLYFVICVLCFLFAKFIWDEIKRLIFGETVFFFSGWLLLIKFIMSFVVNLTLWMFAPFVAPLGILYLWIRK